jgi:hypothetical protein
MAFPHASFGLLLCALAVSMPATVLAQPSPSTNYTTIQATSEKPVQIDFYATANKNCTPAPPPTVRMVEPPKLGTLTVRRGELTTNLAGCPGLKTPAQVVLYRARAGYSGTDHVMYQVTSANGEVALYDVTIEVKEAAKPGGAASDHKL